MREILFRGKKTDDKEWFHGNLLKLNKKTYLVPQNTWFDYGRLKVMVEVNPETVGQYTGLTDKNGKKIFEGDIICSLYMNCPKNEYIEKVTFFDGRFMAENATGSCYGKIAGENSPKHFTFDKSVYMIECEVIGNIHDNKELLDVK